MQLRFAYLEQQIINSPSRRWQNIPHFVIVRKLEMNTITSLNVILSTKNVSINRHNIIKFSDLVSSKIKPILKKLYHFIRAIKTNVSPWLLVLCNPSPKP